ncbi:hypothetical protein [Bradyrhizobium erythrophlei]|uniref:Uncharacterized protein n=1 Tax=Bradyrhizobium erythrophlei TaxID=1437360 RepID=A0A1H5AJ30_9BRAD|nr:hypothetical protein [Bradyrhizobium erythrophlei]SED42327.1 hypothetical protein SAMN05444164_4708 [Bradyrhizobium erythrophlei]
MFEKLAKFRPFQPQRVAPWTIPATYSNDNLPGFRRPADRRRPTPACHWILIDGRLECRWSVETTLESSTNDFDRARRADRYSGPRATPAHCAAKMTASA